MEVLVFILIGAILAIVIPLIDYMTSNKNEYSSSHYKDNSNKQELQNDMKQQRKEKILNIIKIVLIILWNILKWTLLIGFTLIIGLFGILINKKKPGPKGNFWTTPK